MNTLKLLTDATQSLEYVLLDVQRKFKTQIMSLISAMQEGVGYVAFSADVEKPYFRDYSNDDIIRIVAVRVVESNEFTHLEFMTDDNISEDMTSDSGWFNPDVYGTFDYHDLFETLKSIVDKQ